MAGSSGRDRLERLMKGKTIVATGATSGIGEAAVLALAGMGVTANCLHPGVVATRFGDSSGGWVSRLMPVARLFFISPEKGADTIVHLASSPEIEKTSGEYFVKREIIEPSPAARDDAAAKRLWEASEKLAGL